MKTFTHNHHRALHACCVSLILVSAEISLAQGLLIDNFNTTDNPNSANLNYDLATRQAGSSLGTVNWSLGSGYGLLGWTTSPNAMLVAGDGGSTGGMVSLDHSFNGTDSATGLVLEVDLDPQHSTNPSAWLGINIGMTAANRWTGANQAAPHLGVIFHHGNYCQVWDGSANVGNFEPGVWPNTFTRVKLVLTDATDGNPLDGVGQTTLSIYIGSSTQAAFTYTKESGGLSGGYINFQATPADYGLIDNLRIAKFILVPSEPPAVTIATYAGLAINGVVGGTYGIQASSTLGGEDGWVGVANVTLTAASQLWYDSQSTSQQPRRFYRVVPGLVSIP